ncbi:MAG: NAD(P)-dependent oxidoreductase [Bacteroidaceae bacterium]|nr:NAD(P)-dependent oxidoreductase [Bacteroidaceae bacterium]
MKSILITGASGFIGSFIVEEALNRGLEVWAAVRSTSSRRYLNDERIKFLDLDFSTKDSVRKTLQGHHWDYIVHAAGATKCLHKSDFYKVNTLGTKNFIDAIIDLDIIPEKFVFMSSLSAVGAVREPYPYTDIEESDIPVPNTTYGDSKMSAERYLEQFVKKVPIVMLRPTGVYGPREKDYLMMADSIRRHVDFAVGFRPQEITFVYVADLVKAVFLALERGESGRKFFISDGNVYRSADFSKLIKKELGISFVFRIVAPVWLLWIICQMGDLWGRMTGKMSALNMDKFNILRQRNWRCDIRPAREELGYEPEYDLTKGVRSWLKDEFI